MFFTLKFLSLHFCIDELGLVIDKKKSVEIDRRMKIFYLGKLDFIGIFSIAVVIHYVEQVDIQNFIGYKDKIRKAIIIIIIVIIIIYQ